MADRDHNQVNLEAFNQELTEAVVPRNKRRSSILKAVDNNLPEDRRQSRRISFHTNILCQQILPDGTTQVVTEALKAKLPADSSASTVSEESRNSLPDRTEDENNSRKRASSGPSNSGTGQKKRKDPKVVAQSYQNFIKRTYDAENENDYDTVFNTSVNRNGFPVASRDQRLDVTKLFAVEQTGALMDITKVLTTSNDGQIQDENDATASQTRLFSDFSMSLEESLSEVGNVSEMDTAMIIDDEVFDNSDEKVKQSVPNSDTSAATAEQSAQQLELGPSHAVAEPVVIADQESIVDVSMSIVSEQENGGSQEPAAEKTKVFENCGMDETEAAVDQEKAADEQEKTQLFSQGSSITIEKNMSKDISPPSSQEPTACTASSAPKEHRDDDLFQDKSASFRNNNALTLAFSRVSFPRNLDKVLRLRREQMNKTLETLKDADISSDVDSYSDSPRTSIHNETSSFHVPDKTSVLFEKSSLVTHSIDASKATGDPDAGDSLFHDPDVQDKSAETNEQEVVTDRHVSPSSESSGFLNSSDRVSQTSSDQTEECDPQPDCKQTLSTKHSSSSHFLSSTAVTSFDESGSEGDMSCFEQTINEPDDMDEEEEANALHEDSLFEMYQGAESSFIISPDSSFHSSFICQEDTLLLLGEDIDAKLSQFAQNTSLDLESGQSADDHHCDLTFVPLKNFNAGRSGARLVTDDPDQLIVFFMFETIRVTIDLGVTVRSFNGIPIKVIRRIGIESLTKSSDFAVQDDFCSPIDYSDEKMRGLIVIAHEMLVSAFEERKGAMISKYSTSDQLSDVLSEISDLVKVSREFLQELAITSLLYPTQVYRKHGKEYDLAFELTGRRRNFFLILAVDPSTYPFASLKVRFGFDRDDRSLYHVNNFAKALSLVVKPGRHYMTRMIDAAKKYVLISRKISRSKN